MKYLLSECVDRINQTLNFPSIAYEDISLFLDQAIAELNTSLHIQIRPISELVKSYTNNVKYSPLVLFTSEPTSKDIVPIGPGNYPEDKSVPCYYNPEDGYFYVLELGVYKQYDKVYGVYNEPATGNIKYYKAIILSSEAIVWYPVNDSNPTQYDLTEVLPRDWITLFLIPYVCFKYSVRDGDNGTLYAEEFQQGFQQLQNSYDVPSRVQLFKWADHPAYTQDAKEALAKGNINIWLPTRAITEDMLHGRVVMPVYGSVFDNGGWGI